MFYITVSNDALRGANATDAAYVQQWVNFADNEILPATCTWVFPCMGIMQFNKQVQIRSIISVKNDVRLCMIFGVIWGGGGDRGR